MTMSSKKDQLLKSAKRRYANVELEEGLVVKIRNLNGREVSEFASKFSVEDTGSASFDQLVDLCRLALVEDDGELMFPTKESAEPLNDIEFATLVKLANAIQIHCRLVEDADVRIRKN